MNAHSRAMKAVAQPEIGAPEIRAPEIRVIDSGHETAEFREAVLAGLAEEQKRIPCTFFYDEHGSKLFEDICALPEYYPTRTEIALLGDHGREIAALAGPGATLVEFGSGASLKERIVLDALIDPRGYVAIDISRDHMIAAADALACDFPGLDVVAVCADFTQGVALPDLVEGRRLGFFPGSTIGNFTPGAAVAFLRRAAESLGPGSAMLIGVDLQKPEPLLHAAYNDKAGVTAAFNLNILARINRELEGGFDLAAFAHEAPYDREDGCVRMYLRSLRRQTVPVAGRAFPFAEGERIHTENSHKFTIDGFHALARCAGYRPVRWWVDSERLFSLHFLAVEG